MQLTRYRFWHKTARQLCPVRHIERDATGKLPFLWADIALTRSNGSRIIECCTYRDGILMAATGIEDRYGAAIFEGDILNVRGRGEWGEPAVVVRDKRRAGFAYAFPGGAADPVALRPGDDIEVVGNIHEHPTLLP
jgi:hypothetical protein